jgi:hypothetical protein
VVESNLDAFGHVVANGTYTRSTTYSVTLDSLRVRIDVKVSWTDRAGRSHGVTLSGERIP